MSVYGLEPVRFLARDGKVMRGIKQVVQVPNPAAGADWVASVPGGEQWRVLAGRFVLTASAAVANRVIELIATVDGLRIWQTFDPTAIVANNVRTENILPGVGFNMQTASNGSSQLALPDMFMPQGSQLGTITAAIDVADQYNNIALYVERVYLPDQKLDEIAECEQRAYFDAMRKAGMTQGA